MENHSTIKHCRVYDPLDLLMTYGWVLILHALINHLRKISEEWGKKRNYDSHIHMCRSEMQQKTANHNTQIDNGVRHNFAYVSGPFLYGGGFFISVRKLNSMSLQCWMVSRLIWSCSPRSLESCTKDDTRNRCLKLSEIVRQHLLLNSFPASNWLDLALPQHLCSPKLSKSCPKAPSLASKWPWLNSGESWLLIPNFLPKIRL